MKDISNAFARFLLQISTKEDVDSIEQWNKKSDQNSSFTHNLKTFWNNPSDENLKGDLSSVRERLIARMSDTRHLIIKKNRTSYYLGRIAAILIFTISIASLSIYFASESNLFYQKNWVEVSTEAGQQSKVNLPDGTLVWLNSQTTLKYQPNKKTRNVVLTGEAYFEVSHAADYPFIVETEESHIKVLGTKFNVSNYPELQTTEASLIEGRILFSASGVQKSIELMPGEKIVFNRLNNEVERTDEKVEDDILWRQGILSFDNEPFNRLIFRLEKHYAVKFSYEKKNFESMHYTGYIDNLNIDNVLDFITMTIPIEYEINNNSITLKLKTNGE